MTPARIALNAIRQRVYDGTWRVQALRDNESDDWGWLKQSRRDAWHWSLDMRRILYDYGDGRVNPERVFAEQWAMGNVVNPGLNTGHGILQGLLLHPNTRNPRFVVSKRDAAIAATVVQWLGTNVGFSWLCATLRLAGYRVVRDVDYQRLKDNIQAARQEEKRAVMEAKRVQDALTRLASAQQELKDAIDGARSVVR